jgi:2-methylcitrate dehydratase
MVMYPSGHARNTSANLEDILHHKAEALGSIALANADSVINQFGNIANLDVAAIGSLMDFKILNRPAID